MGPSATVVLGWAGACIGIFAASAALADVRIDENPDAITIWIEGKITTQDFNRLDAKIEQLAKKRGTREITAVLNSPGGVHFAGLRLGLLFKKNGVQTVVPPGALCASACSSVFFGGYDRRAGKPSRMVHETSRVGVHRMYRADGGVSGVEKRTRVERGARWYFDEISVSAKVRSKFFETPPEQMYFLTPEDMAESDIRFVPKAAANPQERAPERSATNPPPEVRTASAYPDPLAALPGVGIAQCRQLRTWQRAGTHGQAPAAATMCFKSLEATIDRDCPPASKPSLDAVMTDLLTTTRHHTPQGRSNADALRLTLAGLGCR